MVIQCSLYPDLPLYKITFAYEKVLNGLSYTILEYPNSKSNRIKNVKFSVVIDIDLTCSSETV